jgi:hypothetical protein
LALLLAIAGRVRSAIVALGALMLLDWVHQLRSAAIRDDMGLIQFALTFIYPGIAAAAIWLALRDRRLGLAFTFVAMPTLVYLLVMGPFIIITMIAGRAAP